MAKIKKVYTKAELVSITPEQLNKLTQTELRYMVSSMNRMISRQRTQLEQVASETGIQNIQALQAIKRHTPTAFTEEGELKTLNQLRSEFQRGQELFSFKTYSKSGVEQAYGKQIEKIKSVLGLGSKDDHLKDMFDSQYVSKVNETFWESYDKFKEVSPDVFQFIDSERVQEELRDIMARDSENLDTSDLALSLENWYEGEYKRIQKERKAKLDAKTRKFSRGGNS